MRSYIKPLRAAPFHPYPGCSGRYIFCGTFRIGGVRPDQSGIRLPPSPLASTLPYGVRTFLSPTLARPPKRPLGQGSDRPAYSRRVHNSVLEKAGQTAPLERLQVFTGGAGLGFDVSAQIAALQPLALSVHGRRYRSQNCRGVKISAPFVRTLSRSLSPVTRQRAFEWKKHSRNFTSPGLRHETPDIGRDRRVPRSASRDRGKVPR